MIAAASAVLDATLPLVIRPCSDADRRGYCLGSWKEAYKQAPKMRHMTWSIYKAHAVPLLQGATDRPDTEMIGAYHDGEIVGWIALARGRRVDVVHWVHTRFAVDGQEFRRRGIMRTLFDAAQLQPRIVYTFRGPIPKHRVLERREPTSDKWIASWLARRGHATTHVPYKEWSAE